VTATPLAAPHLYAPAIALFDLWHYHQTLVPPPGT